jgi:gas vesicle protein
MNDKDSGNVVAFLVGLLVGGLAGAATVLLLTPQSGEGMRAQIRRRVIELRDRTEGILDQARARLEPAATDAGT